MKFLDHFEQEASAQSEYYKKHRQKDLRYCPGRCKVCGKHFDVLLHSHAEADGYKDAYEMINKGLIIFDFERYENGEETT